MGGEKLETVPRSHPATHHIHIETFQRRRLINCFPFIKSSVASCCPQRDDLGLGSLLPSPASGPLPHNPRMGSSLPVSGSPLLPGQYGKGGGLGWHCRPGLAVAVRSAVWRHICGDCPTQADVRTHLTSSSDSQDGAPACPSQKYCRRGQL